MRRRLRTNEASRFWKIVINLVLGILAVSMLLPIWNTLVVSFTTNLESYETTFKLWPHHFSIIGYVTLFERARIWLPFVNNVYITVIGTVLHVAVNAMAGFALTRRSFPGKTIIALLLLIPLMIPGESIIIPRYIVLRHLGMLNTLWSVIIINIANTFPIFLMRNYFLSIPSSLEESAYMDGAGLAKIFMRIYVPLSTPGLATITLMEMVGKWNTLFSAVLYINSPSKYTLQQALKILVVDTDSPLTSGLSIPNNAQTAGVIIALVPVLLLYPFIQRYFIRGAFLGALKE